MQLKQIGQQLEDNVPAEFAEEWDNVGWMVGPLEEKLKGIVVCVDPSPEALEFTLENNCNLLLSHHPLFFEPVKRLTTAEPLQKMVMEAISADIGIYAMHTNADGCPGGLNDLFARYLGLEETQPLVENEMDSSSGLGRVGSYSSPVLLSEIEEKFSSHPRISYFQTVHAGEEEIEQVAVCTGSGGDFLDNDVVRATDLYISGDIKHHQVENARMHGLNLINLDHYEMETFFLNFAQELLEDQLAVDCPVSLFERENPYLHYVNSNVQR
ncbi:MAG: Nif3-like dinuclear metal center hexameric protein [bacterium]